MGFCQPFTLRLSFYSDALHSSQMRVKAITFSTDRALRTCLASRASLCLPLTRHATLHTRTHRHKSVRHTMSSNKRAKREGDRRVASDSSRKSRSSLSRLCLHHSLLRLRSRNNFVSAPLLHLASHLESISDSHSCVLLLFSSVLPLSLALSRRL